METFHFFILKNVSICSICEKGDADNVFFDREGFVHIEFMQKSATINASYYYETLKRL